MTSAPPMPQGQQDQGQPQQGLMQGMAPEQKPQAPNQQEQMRAAMMQFQQLDEEINNLARQFPEFSEAARTIKDSIKDGLMKVIGSAQRGTEAQSMPLL